MVGLVERCYAVSGLRSCLHAGYVIGASFIHSFYVWNLACEAHDRAKDFAAQDPSSLQTMRPRRCSFPLPRSRALSTRSWTSTACGRCRWSLPHRAGMSGNVEASRVVEMIERSKGQTELKYMMASQVLSGRMFDRGSAPLQDVRTLFDLRNMIMHPKPVAQNVKRRDSTRISSEMPAKIRTLQTWGLRAGTEGGSWFAVLQTYEMAAWACETARSIMRTTIAMLPPGYHQIIFTDMIEKSEVRSGQKSL